MILVVKIKSIKATDSDRCDESFTPGGYNPEGELASLCT
jgi:hypothetical protein